MKIFSSFDTQRCVNLYKVKVKEYGVEKVIVLRLCKYFWYFQGFLRGIVITIFLFLFLYYSFYFAFSEYVFVLAIPAFLMLYWIFVVKNFISYKLNFLIITPDAVYTHMQKGILYNTFREIPTLSVRNVELLKNSLLGNILGYGHISLSSDIENSIEKRKQSLGVIYFPYVQDAYKVTQEISKLLHHDA